MWTWSDKERRFIWIVVEPEGWLWPATDDGFRYRTQRMPR